MTDAEKQIDIDLKKYIGEWNEVSATPAWFENGCERVTAEYSMINEKQIKVDNTCFTHKVVCDNVKKSCQKVEKARKKIGKAFTTDRKDTIKVQFFPLVKAPYKVLYVDGGEGDQPYQHAIVSSGKYTWILSRELKINPDKLKQLKEKAEQLGRNINKLIEKTEKA